MAQLKTNSTVNGGVNYIAAVGSSSTFTANQTFQGVSETVTTKTASFTPDVSTESTFFMSTGSANIILTTPSPSAGKSFTYIHKSSGSLTFSGTIKWKDGAAPAPTTGAGDDVYAFWAEGSAWYGSYAGTYSVPA